MLIGLLSDTHDNVERTKLGLSLLTERGVERLLHMGDLTTGELVALLLDHQVHLVRGNIDAPDTIHAAIAEHKADIHYDEVHELTIDGVRIGMQHGDDEARLEGMINSGAFDLVLHGHTHTFRDETVGGTRVVNPGALHNTDAPSVCVYDTQRHQLERILLRQDHG